MEIFQDFTTLVEPLSLDEAYLDVSDSVTPQHPPGLIGQELKTRVKAELHLSISVGVATTKSVAKIASDLEKPDGLTIVPPGSERKFLAPLAVDKLWGIGPKTATRLANENVHTIEDLAAQSREWCHARFGKIGYNMRLLAQGRDNREVVATRSSKSVSAETTLTEDTDDPGALFELVNRLTQRVSITLNHRNLHGRTVKLKLRLSDFTTFTRQTTVAEPVSSSIEIATAATALLRAELQPGRLFRLVGVGVSGFEDRYVEAIQLRMKGF
jgi:DNA polymerase-4